MPLYGTLFEFFILFLFSEENTKKEKYFKIIFIKIIFLYPWRTYKEILYNFFLVKNNKPYGKLSLNPHKIFNNIDSIFNKSYKPLWKPLLFIPTRKFPKISNLSLF